MKKPFVYLAGPFFNPDQLDLIAAIEANCEAAGVPCFSPRVEIVLTKDASEADRQRAFQSNMQGLARADVVLAVLDYKLPRLTYVRLVDYTTNMQGPKLHLPDTGTVWEMGFATGKDIPVVGFTEKQPGEGTLNVMLGESCQSIVYGRQQLDVWLHMLDADKPLPAGRGWEGDTR